MSKDPLVSVIVPVYNCERYLAQAVKSVLAQTYCPIELIVVDDGSTDGSAEQARGFAAAVRLYTQPHRGAAAARNSGVELARADLLAFLDADDLWAEDKLTYQLEAMQGDRQVDMVFGHVVHFYSPDLDGEARARIMCPSAPEPGYAPGTMLITRQAFARAGPFVTRWRVGEFIDWYLRASDLGLTSVMLPQVLLKRRLHADNTGIRQRDARSDYARIVKWALDRRRKAEAQNGRSARDGAEEPA